MVFNRNFIPSNTQKQMHLLLKQSHFALYLQEYDLWNAQWVAIYVRKITSDYQLTVLTFEHKKVPDTRLRAKQGLNNNNKRNSKLKYS